MLDLPTYTPQIDTLPPPERADYARYIEFVLSGDDPDFEAELYLWPETIII